MTNDSRDGRGGPTATDAMRQALAAEAQARDLIREEGARAAERLADARARARAIQEVADARILRAHRYAQRGVSDAPGAAGEADVAAGEAPGARIGPEALSAAVTRVAERLISNGATGEEDDDDL